MIFLTIGTQEPFTRLVRAVDAWAATHDTEIVGQITDPGMSEYTPQNFEAFGRTNPTRYTELLQRSDLIVSHAGMGSILTALSNAKPILVMPRSAALGEHRNEHQRATVNELSGRPGIFVAPDEHAIPDMIETALAAASGAQSPISDRAQDRLITAMRGFILDD